MSENQTKAKTKLKSLFSPKTFIKSDFKILDIILIQLNIERDIYYFL
jgi:hypothetical protein